MLAGKIKRLLSHDVLDEGDFDRKVEDRIEAIHSNSKNEVKGQSA